MFWFVAFSTRSLASRNCCHLVIAGPDRARTLPALTDMCWAQAPSKKCATKHDWCGEPNQSICFMRKREDRFREKRVCNIN